MMIFFLETIATLETIYMLHAFARCFEMARIFISSIFFLAPDLWCPDRGVELIKLQYQPYFFWLPPRHLSVPASVFPQADVIQPLTHMAAIQIVYPGTLIRMLLDHSFLRKCSR